MRDLKILACILMSGFILSADNLFVQKKAMAAEDKIETASQPEGARASDQAREALDRATELSRAPEVASAQAEEATGKAKDALGIKPPPAASPDE